MREPRIKISPEEAAAVYHAITRTVNGEMLFEEEDCEMLRRLLWRVADYCGIFILTYLILNNHLHVVPHVPRKTLPPDAELLRRYRALNPPVSKYQIARMAVIEAQLANGSPEGERWRQRQFAQMGDLSQFMKLVKQRFTMWYNQRHDRFGTIWAERFTSILVEGTGAPIKATSAYVDLNAVRAGIVSDPADYRFSGYAEAVAGNVKAQRGIMMLMEIDNWEEAQAAYRKLLFGVGSTRSKGKLISPEALARVLAEGGKRPLATILRYKVRYMTRGGIIGSRAFVAQEIERWRTKFGWKRARIPRALPPVTDWGGLTALRLVRI